MSVNKPNHDLVTSALDNCLTEFVETTGIEAKITTEEPFGKFSQRQVDNFVEFSEPSPHAPLAIEFESGVKTYPRIKTEITDRFEYYRSKGFYPILAATGFVLNGDKPNTVENTAQELGAGVLETRIDQGSVRFLPQNGMNEGTSAQFAAFLKDYVFKR